MRNGHPENIPFGGQANTILRFVPSIVGLTAFAIMAILYFDNNTLYMNILKYIGILPWSYPFIDSEFMYVMKNSWQHGINIYQGIPDDVVPGNRMAYSPLWPRLPFLSSDKAVTNPIGVITDVLLIASVSILPPARTWTQAFILSLALVSTMVCFALERNNIDVWIYLAVVFGGLFLARSYPIRLLVYALYCFVGILKYYPMVLLALALVERPIRAAIIFALAGLALAAFAVSFWDEIVPQLAAIPRVWPRGDVVGIVNLPIAAGGPIARLFPSIPQAQSIVQIGLRLLLSLIVSVAAIRLAHRPGFGDAMANLGAGSRNWLVIGCLLMGGCYLAGQSVGYRGVHLLFVLTGLLALTGVTADHTLRRIFSLTTLTIVLLMWMEGVRLWTGLTLDWLMVPAPLNPLLQFGVFLLREGLWLYLEIIMLAVLFSFAVQSETGGWALRRWLPAEANTRYPLVS